MSKQLCIVVAGTVFTIGIKSFMRNCSAKLIRKISLHVSPAMTIICRQPPEKSSPDLESVTIPGFFYYQKYTARYLKYTNTNAKQKLPSFKK